MNFVALHGFLGSLKDWELLDMPWNVLAIALHPKRDFQTFAKEFNAWAKKNLAPPRGIMGYSLGGRLALHALLDDPSLWSKGILISTHPGLCGEEEKQKRVKHDQAWAKRFLQDPWDILMKDWEAQEVFKNETYRFFRKEADYKREDLAKWLTHFSLGLQENLLPKIQELSLPLFWVTGEFDHAYRSFAKQACERHSFSKEFVILGGYHRGCFASPEVFSDCILT